MMLMHKWMLLGEPHSQNEVSELSKLYANCMQIVPETGRQSPDVRACRNMLAASSLIFQLYHRCRYGWP